MKGKDEKKGSSERNRRKGKIDLDELIQREELKLNLIEVGEEGVGSLKVIRYVYEGDNKLFHLHTLVLLMF